MKEVDDNNISNYEQINFYLLFMSGSILAVSRLLDMAYIKDMKKEFFTYFGIIEADRRNGKGQGNQAGNNIPLEQKQPASSKQDGQSDPPKIE